MRVDRPGSNSMSGRGSRTRALISLNPGALASWGENQGRAGLNVSLC
jgi:hypothetical protein